jgi:3-oxoacyl-[acyl-carrier protein] reductase
VIKVHNAGLANTDTTAETKIETFNDLVNTNVRAPFFLTQACLPYIPRGGRIILLSSISARVPNPYVTVPLYAVTKAANEALARDWASEFGHSRGINVNGRLRIRHIGMAQNADKSPAIAVAPGMVATDILDIVPDEIKLPMMAADSAFVAAAPRIGQPDDVAQVVAFLASEGARWVTGSTVSASGGRIFI